MEQQTDTHGIDSARHPDIKEILPQELIDTVLPIPFPHPTTEPETGKLHFLCSYTAPKPGL